MRIPRLLWLHVLLFSCSLCASCGRGTAIDPNGGEVCTRERTVCLVVPPGGLADHETFRIETTSDVPAGALSEGYEISPVGGDGVTFLKPAKILFSMDLVNQEGLPNENLLRIYSRSAEGDWQPLGKSFVDRVRNQVTGETSHLSPFVVLRADQ